MRTIEIAEKRYELASLWERWFGQFLDGIIYCIIIVVGVILVAFTGLAEIGVGIGIILALLYCLFQDGLRNGQSYGKRIVKTKVIDSRNGLPCTFGQSFIRNLLLAILGFIDWIFIFGEKRQRLGDKAANTLVVKFTEKSASELAYLSDNEEDRTL